MPEVWLKIGQIAALLGVSTKTLRHYQKVGLLRDPSRTEGQYRMYTPEDLECIRQIRDLQNLGLTLNEIGYVLNSTERDQVLQQLLTLKVQELDRQIEHMQGQKRKAEHLLQTGQPFQGVLEQKVPDVWKTQLENLSGTLSATAIAREKQLMGKMLSYPTLQDPAQLEQDIRFMEEHPELRELLVSWTQRVDQTDDPAELNHLALEFAESEFLRPLLGPPEVLNDPTTEFILLALLPPESKERAVLEQVRDHLKRRHHEPF